MYLTCELGGRIGTENLKVKDEFRKYNTIEDFDFKGKCKGCKWVGVCVATLNAQKAKLENDLKYICIEHKLV